MGFSMRRTLFVVPALNEGESLPAMLKELREVVDDDFDVVVIDDGSTDATTEVARARAAPFRPSWPSRSASAAPSAWV